MLIYVSIMMDATRHHTCTQHATGLAKIIQKTAHIVMVHPLQVLTSHSVVAYVNSLRQQRISKVLEAPNLTFIHEGINMADRMGTGEPHECEREVVKSGKPRLDLRGEPLQDAELYTDGCCFRHDTEGLKARYAVVRRTGDAFETTESGQLEGQQSVQRAELKAVIAALGKGEGRRITIYTDSAYVVGAVHVELGQWMRAGFLTSGNKPIKHEQEMWELADALQLPEEVAIVKCKGHVNANTTTARGNQEANQVAKRAARYTSSLQMVSVEEELLLVPHLTSERIMEEQKRASLPEKTVWKQRGATNQEGLWRGPDG